MTTTIVPSAPAMMTNTVPRGAARVSMTTATASSAAVPLPVMRMSIVPAEPAARSMITSIPLRHAALPSAAATMMNMFPAAAAPRLRLLHAPPAVLPPITMITAR